MKAPVALAIFSVFAAPLAAYGAPKVSFTAPADGQTISGSFYQSSGCQVTGNSIAQRQRLPSGVDGRRADRQPPGQPRYKTGMTDYARFG